MIGLETEDRERLPYEPNPVPSRPAPAHDEPQDDAWDEDDEEDWLFL